MPRPSDPNALRRTGKHVHLLLTPEEHELYAADARSAGVSLAEHIRQLLKKAHQRARRL